MTTLIVIGIVVVLIVIAVAVLEADGSNLPPAPPKQKKK